MLRVSAGYPGHIADVGIVHTDQVIVLLIVAFCHLTRPVPRAGDVMLFEYGQGAVVDPISNFLRAGGRGINVEAVGETAGVHHMLQDELSHGGAADVSMADK